MVYPFNRVWNKEKRWHWKILKEKRKRKGNFLLRKYGCREVMDCVTEVEGITVGDQTIPCTFSSNPQYYGGVELSGEENKTLCLPPKFAVYDRVNLTSCEAQIEKGLAKLRWSMIHQAESYRDEEEEEGRKRVWPLDLEAKTVNFQYLRPTDLPFNRRVCLPDALESEKEIDMQHLKGRLVRTAKEYITDRKVGSTGNNLATEERQGLRSLKANKDIVVY